VAQGAHIARLTWSASTGAGLFCYIVYRDDVRIGTATALSFSDSTCSESASYTFKVSAISRSNLESAKASAQITMPADQGATIYSVDANSGPTTLVVTFDEALDPATAQAAGNYAIAGGNVTVSGAALSADGKTVTLTTSAMNPGTNYPLTVRNVLDKATSPHASSATKSFTYNGLAHGLTYETFSTCSWDSVTPQTGTPVKTGVVKNFDLSNSTVCHTRFKGYISIPKSGPYEIKFNLYYHGTVTIDNNRIISLRQNYMGNTVMSTLTLAAGLHPLTVEVATVVSNKWIFGWYVGPDGFQHRISDDMLFYSANGQPVGAIFDAPPPIARGIFTIRQTSSFLNANIGLPGRYSLALTAPDGAIVRSYQGMHPALWRMPTGKLPRGVYFVKVAGQGMTLVQPILVK